MIMISVYQPDTSDPRGHSMITSESVVSLKASVKKHHSCPAGREDNATATVLTVLDDGRLHLYRDLHGCRWWNINDVELACITTDSVVTLKTHVKKTHSCPAGRDDNATATVLAVLDGGGLHLDRDLHGCRWWNIDDVKLA